MTAAALGLALLAPALAFQQEGDAATFPVSTALAEGVSPDALARLDRLVQSFVDDGEIVGAELLVLKNEHAILHGAYGWRDREGKVPMEPGSVFCVRSMTKPVVGAAIRMLAEDHELHLDDPVARFLPSFDVEASRAITLAHLLGHTSGLPMSLILGTDPRGLRSIRAVADLGAGRALDFAPGSAFQYSDQGADTLTAVIEAITGSPAEDFVRARVLEPLGMTHSACIMTADSPLRAHACSDYAGSPGAWTRFWSPADPALFPIFLGSQGLYSTVEDYARFLGLWMHHGRPGKERLLRMSSVREALEPGPFPLGSPTGFPGLRADYGSLLQLWTRAPEKGAEGEREVVVFGHTGSDGTHAWAFPGQNAMVLYFTQSRGTLTGLRVEEVLGELFLGAAYDPSEAAPPLEPYLGYYRSGENDEYRAVVRDGDDLALEVPGTGVVKLIFAGDDRWKIREDPSTPITFERAESGAVTALRIGERRRERFTPAPDLPDAGELAARVAAAHHVERLAELGPLHLRSRLRIEKLDRTGEIRSWFAWPDRWRIDEAVGTELARTAIVGDVARSSTSGQPVTTLEAAVAADLRLDEPAVRFGDWRRTFPHLETVQRLAHGDEVLYVVRAGDLQAPARTYLVDAGTDRVVREDAITWIAGMGRTGRRITFSDFQETSGIVLPHRTEIEFPNPMIGTIVVTTEDVELGGEVPAGLFELRD